MQSSTIEMLVQANRDLMRRPEVREKMNVIFQEQVQEARRLIQLGKCVNEADANGWTALMEACIFGNYELIELLLTNGAKVHACDVNGRTALNVALDNDHPEVAGLLVSYARPSVGS